MYLHLGQNTVIPEKNILGIFDLDHTTVSKHTRNYLTKAQKENRVINVSMELPKSFLVCLEKGAEIVYLSQISASTLFRRASESRIFSAENESNG